MRFVITVLLMLLLALPSPLVASYAYYVGRNLTEDGSVLLGGSGEEPSSHWLEIVPARQHPPDATITVGATEAARLPARLSAIPQVSETSRYITMNYSSFAGFPAPLTNGGLNEHQVAIRDVWAPSREELTAMTSKTQTGPQYSDLARIALERARTAREAVELMGELIDRHGYTTYGGNSHLIADPEEGWVMLQFAGSAGLWVAERLGPDDVRVNYPGYIEEIPPDYQRDPDYLGSDNLISFAVEQGWYDPEVGEPFNVDRVYGLGTTRARGTKYLSPADIEAELEAMVPVSVNEMMALVRDERITDDHAGYGQVAHLRRKLPHPELALLWVAPTGSVTAPFLPWWIGVEHVLPEYGQHRYLTEGAASSYITTSSALREATLFAGRLYKRLMYYTCAHPNEYLPRVQRALASFEARIMDEQPRIERTAFVAYQDDASLGRDVLTRYANARATDALELGRDLLGSIEAEVKLLHGIPAPPHAEDMNAGGVSVNCLEGIDPDQPPQ